MSQRDEGGMHGKEDQGQADAAAAGRRDIPQRDSEIARGAGAHHPGCRRGGVVSEKMVLLAPGDFSHK